MQKEFFQILGFNSKEGTNGVYQKKYASGNNYSIEIDFKSGKINYGDLIRTESKSTQNFSERK